MPDKFAVIRLTLKVDMDDTKEKAFVRAMLRRLNVLFAKCRPKGALIEILNGNKLSDAYDGKQAVGQKMKEPKVNSTQKYLGFHVVKPVEKSKPETIVEQSMEPPAIVAEISGG
jgi:hypothetical protein